MSCAFVGAFVNIGIAALSELLKESIVILEQTVSKWSLSWSSVRRNRFWWKRVICLRVFNRVGILELQQQRLLLLFLLLGHFFHYRHDFKWTFDEGQSVVSVGNCLLSLIVYHFTIIAKFSNSRLMQRINLYLNFSSFLWLSSVESSYYRGRKNFLYLFLRS